MCACVRVCVGGGVCGLVGERVDVRECSCARTVAFDELWGWSSGEVLTRMRMRVPALIRACDMRACTHSCVWVCMCVFVSALICLCDKCKYAVHECVSSSARMSLRVCVSHARARAHTHSHTHTHAHTHAHTLQCEAW